MKSILIDVHKRGVKLCITENGDIVEFWAEKDNLAPLVGNIYKGKVENVLAGMEAAFVNIGIERCGFLYAGDTLVEDNNFDEVSSKQHLKLSPGDTVMCQVVKDEFGTKGARITMNISLPGHYLVLSPLVDYVGISRKITNEATRERLKALVEEHRNGRYGVIVRTEAEHADPDAIINEINDLKVVWERIKHDFKVKPQYSLLYAEDDLLTRAMRDMYRTDVGKIIINDEVAASQIRAKFGYLLKSPQDLEIYEGAEPIFSYYGVNKAIEKLLRRKVMLKNGAYLIIDRTEALTIIDVNTGRYVGNKNLEETVYKTNLIAAEEIARQLRLRNLGGIIIVDFIDMAVPEHKEGLLAALGEALAKDSVKCTIVSMTPLGLVEITRKRTRSLLESVMLQPCPYCNGDSYIYSDEHIIMLLRDKLAEIFNESGALAVRVHVNPQIFSKMFALRYFERECESIWQDKRIYVIPDEKLHIQKFEIEKESNIILDLPDTAKLLY